MGTRGELFSSKVFAGKRTYFFNVKENRYGELFLAIVESRKDELGEGFERDQVVVYREDLYRFLNGLREALKEIERLEQERSDDELGSFRL
ncbi:DUF3276 family protein [Spirochaeta thermophila]|uniref:PUR-alpha/beta/gamma DNA/RNA-binding protein n=2 Tax=Winmispira thermophila TaxID=154 RepID=G0GDJ9_WINT7|nr:DUF3276 family protein [Spirochaeta thermophila]ADN01992.1 hypothetical protein STHERM_c10470 [Spirochaeta thermophila DSM 6192]AEJ61346.1 PUR-alpha/beta/gamma DNA/RNA-binding protein [Spirochaeta thermophila DSM 6578]